MDLEKVAPKAQGPCKCGLVMYSHLHSHWTTHLEAQRPLHDYHFDNNSWMGGRICGPYLRKDDHGREELQGRALPFGEG